MGELYSKDFYGWLVEQAEALRLRSANKIDWENLLEEVEGLARSERRELGSRLAVLIQHLLKWRSQPERRSRSWLVTIKEQRAKVVDILEESPSLQQHLPEIIDKAYRTGLADAITVIGQDLLVAKLEGPMTFERVMSEEPEWSDCRAQPDPL